MSPRDPLVQAWPLLGLRVRRIALAVAFGALSLGSALGLTAVSAWLITRAWEMPPVLHLTVAAVTVRALGISRGVLAYCERLASHDTALRAAGTARERLFSRLAAGPEDTVMRRSSGDLVARVGAGVDELSDVVVRAVVPICVAALLGVSAVVAIALISPAAATVLAVCLLVAGVLAPALAAHAARSAETIAVEHHSSRDDAVLLALEHAPELRVSGRLAEVITTATDEQRRWGDAIDRAAAPAAVAAAAPTAAVGVSVLGALLAGIALADTTAATTVAILMLLPLAAFEATAALPGAAVALTRGRIAARRLLAVTEPATDDRRPAVTPLVLRPGARVAVVGPSGCGKTTLLMRSPGSSSPRTPTCSRPPSGTTCWSRAVTPVTTNCATRWARWDSERGSTICRRDCPPCSSAAPPRCRQASADDFCWHEHWYQPRRQCFSTSRRRISTPPTPTAY